MSARSLVERLARNLRFRRRLPHDYGGHTIWTSSDARLRYLRLGSRAFDHELLECARRFISAGQVVYDIGANVGEFAVAACHYVGPHGAVLAVEPDPFLCSLLHRTIAEPENAGLPLESLCAAAAERDGFETFNIASRGRASNALVGHGTPTMGGARSQFTTPVFKIDTIVKTWRAPDFIKIDVEGAELRVLEGAKQTLAQTRPIVLIEVTTEGDLVQNLFRELGYRLFAPTTDDGVVEIQQCVFNTLAVPKEKTSVFEFYGGVAS